MTFSRVKSCVDQGLCTWEQVRHTLSNAGVLEPEIASFTTGDGEIGRSPQAMLGQLIETGIVPVETLTGYEAVEASASMAPRLPDLLYCLNVLRTLPSEAPSKMSDAMFGTYRNISLTNRWVRDRFGECDTHFGPHRFFGYTAFDGTQPVAIVWARADEVNNETLKAQLRARLELRGIISLVLESESIGNDQ